MDKTKQISALEELSSYVITNQSHLQYHDINLFYNLIAYTFSDGYKDNKLPDNFTVPMKHGYGLGSDCMEYFGKQIRSTDTSLDEKKQCAQGVQDLNHMNRLYIKDNSSKHFIRECEPKDLVTIIHSTINTLKGIKPKNNKKDNKKSNNKGNKKSNSNNKQRTPKHFASHHRSPSFNDFVSPS